MEILKYFKTGKFRKIAIYTLIGILTLYAGVFIYSLVFEQDKLVIDRYNFRQLERVKSVLDNLDKNSYKFDNISEFNKKFNQDIKPIKSCYFLSERNGYFESNKGNGGYIFGFQLESLISKFMYFGNDYAYPKYDLPYRQVCFGGLNINGGWGGGGCYDHNKDSFEWTISNPCKEN